MVIKIYIACVIYKIRFSCVPSDDDLVSRRREKHCPSNGTSEIDVSIGGAMLFASPGAFNSVKSGNVVACDYSLPLYACAVPGDFHSVVGVSPLPEYQPVALCG